MTICSRPEGEDELVRRYLHHYLMRGFNRGEAIRLVADKLDLGSKIVNSVYKKYFCQNPQGPEPK